MLLYLTDRQSVLHSAGCHRQHPPSEELRRHCLHFLCDLFIAHLRCAQAGFYNQGKVIMATLLEYCSLLGFSFCLLLKLRIDRIAEIKQNVSIVRAIKHNHLLQSLLTYLQESSLHVCTQKGTSVKKDTENICLSAFWIGAWVRPQN